MRQLICTALVQDFIIMEENILGSEVDQYSIASLTHTRNVQKEMLIFNADLSFKYNLTRNHCTTGDWTLTARHTCQFIIYVLVEILQCIIVQICVLQPEILVLIHGLMKPSGC